GDLVELVNAPANRLCRKGDMVPIEQNRVRWKRLSDSEQRLSQALSCLLSEGVVPEKRRELVTQVALSRVHREIREQHLGLPARNRQRQARIGAGLEAPQERQPEHRHPGEKIALWGSLQPSRRGC